MKKADEVIDEQTHEILNIQAQKQMMLIYTGLHSFGVKACYFSHPSQHTGRAPRLLSCKVINTF